MKQYSRYLSKDVVESLDYAIRLVSKDIAVDPACYEEKMNQLKTLQKMRNTFEKRKEIIII